MSASRPGRFAHGKEPRYLLSRRLGGPQSRSGRFGGHKNILFLSRFEPRTVQPVVWSLYRLRWLCWKVFLVLNLQDFVKKYRCINSPIYRAYTKEWCWFNSEHY